MDLQPVTTSSFLKAFILPSSTTSCGNIEGALISQYIVFKSKKHLYNRKITQEVFSRQTRVRNLFVHKARSGFCARGRSGLLLHPPSTHIPAWDPARASTCSGKISQCSWDIQEISDGNCWGRSWGGTFGGAGSVCAVDVAGGRWEHPGKQMRFSSWSYFRLCYSPWGIPIQLRMVPFL